MCAQYGRPAGVAFGFQVCRYSIEPPVPNRACNLLPKDMLRAALADEIEKDGPEVSFIGLGESFTCGAEWLARAGTCPQGGGGWDSGKLESVRPSADTRKKVALDVGVEVVWCDFGDGAGIDMSFGDEFLVDEFLEPSCCFGVVFVVVVH